MSKKHKNGRCSWEKWILIYFHYNLPNDFQKPKKSIYFWHYAVIFSLVAYAIITIIDVCLFKFASICSMLLWYLSSWTVITTTIYNMCRTEEKLWKEMLKKQPYLKNRAKYIPQTRKKELIDEKFTRKIYRKALVLEAFGLISGLLCSALAFIYPIRGTVIVFKVIIGLLAFLNCFILIAQNAAEFYGAKDYII